MRRYAILAGEAALFIALGFAVYGAALSSGINWPESIPLLKLPLLALACDPDGIIATISRRGAS